MSTKEEVYDEEINPLMAQIIDICNANKIAFISSFCLDKESLRCCTSALLEDEFDPPREYLKILRILV